MRGVSEAALGKEPHELAGSHLDAPRSGDLAHEGDDVGEPRGLDVDHVQRHLDAPRAGQEQTERLYAAHASARLAHGGRDRLRVLERARPELEVERDQELPRADDDAAGARVEPRRAEVRPHLARVEPALKLGGPAPTKERGPVPVTARAVEEDREAELVPDPPPELVGDVDRPIEPCAAERDDRDDVRSADAGVDAVVLPQVDQ